MDLVILWNNTSQTKIPHGFFIFWNSTFEIWLAFIGAKGNTDRNSFDIFSK
jgi:hypothetical protein